LLARTRRHSPGGVLDRHRRTAYPIGRLIARPRGRRRHTGPCSPTCPVSCRHRALGIGTQGGPPATTVSIADHRLPGTGRRACRWALYAATPAWAAAHAPPCARRGGGPVASAGRRDGDRIRARAAALIAVPLHRPDRRPPLGLPTDAWWVPRLPRGLLGGHRARPGACTPLALLRRLTRVAYVDVSSIPDMPRRVFVRATSSATPPVIVLQGRGGSLSGLSHWAVLQTRAWSLRIVLGFGLAPPGADRLCMHRQSPAVACRTPWARSSNRSSVPCGSSLAPRTSLVLFTRSLATQHGLARPATRHHHRTT